MFKLVDRYVGSSSIKGILTVWLLLCTLLIFFVFLREMRELEHLYTVGDAAWYVALIVPRYAYQVFPIAALLGVLIGAGELAASNELVAFRTAGVSRLRLSVATLSGAMTITLLVMAMGEWLMPVTAIEANAFKLGKISESNIVGGPRGIWVREGNRFINIQRPVLSDAGGNRPVEFQKVVIYETTQNAGLNSITRALSASFDDDQWTLNRVNRLDFEENGTQYNRTRQEKWLTKVKPEIMNSAISRPALLSIRSLAKHIRFLQDNGLETRAYSEAFWEKIMFPFQIAGLILVGMPFVFGSNRSHNMGARLFIGMALGGLLIIVDNIFEQFGSFSHAPPFVTNILPPILLTLTGVLILRRSV